MRELLDAVSSMKNLCLRELFSVQALFTYKKGLLKVIYEDGGLILLIPN